MPNMWTCHKCKKPVYFAERKQSLGHDWHPECLRCEECGKRLNPGQHAEHKGEPYCHVPCYNMLFGPILFGHGSQVEGHNNFGKMEKKFPPGTDRAALESKLKLYNQYYEGNRRQLKWRERNGKLILEGVLRIYWGVQNLIHLKENDDQRHHVQIRKRLSYHEPRSAWSTTSSQQKEIKERVNDNSLSQPNQNLESNKENLESKSESPDDNSRSKVESGNDLSKDSSESEVAEVKNSINGDTQEIQTMETIAYAVNSTQSSTKMPADYSSKRNQFSDEDDYDDERNQRTKREKVDLSHVQIRKLSSSRSKTKLKRRCSINGHYYNRETKTFTPPFSSASNVWVTSMVNTSEVINLLLDKFRVENDPKEFALYVVRDNGETRQIKDEDYPLFVRVLLGPHEDVAKVFIMDKKKTNEISNEVAQYLNFQEPELVAILNKFYEEEEMAVRRIKMKYKEMKRIMKSKIADFQRA